MNKLDQLRQVTTVVADTGDIDAIRKFAPVDATTNPSLLLKAAAMPEYRHLVADALAWSGQQGGDSHEQMENCKDRLAVNFGREILQLIPGRVSTEVSARLSFDTPATLAKARRLIELYEQAGVPRQRILIKVAATWEGIRAAEVLEREEINCNLTLLFSFAQAVACADAGVFLISPFVGRILDWYKAKTGLEYAPEEDPGVLSVARIFNYYKQHGFNTVVMGASFRSAAQIEQLAGCDRLTISPQLLEELKGETGALQVRLDAAEAREADERRSLLEQDFRWDHNDDAMATEKLAEGIRAFHADELKLEQLLRQID